MNEMIAAGAAAGGCLRPGRLFSAPEPRLIDTNARCAG
jgi:hypothetical protein